MSHFAHLTDATEEMLFTVLTVTHKRGHFFKRPFLPGTGLPYLLHLLCNHKTTILSSKLLSNMMNNKRITKAVAVLLGTAAIVKIAYYEAEMVSGVHLCLTSFSGGLLADLIASCLVIFMISIK
jgi:hypothetical protein